MNLQTIFVGRLTFLSTLRPGSMGPLFKEYKEEGKVIAPY
jgi:hypothetical protein